MTGNWEAGKEWMRTGRASGGPLLEADLCGGSSRACEMREGREAEIRENDEMVEVRRIDGSERVGTYGGPGMEDGMERWQMTWWGVSLACQQTGTLVSGTVCLQGRCHGLVPYRVSSGQDRPVTDVRQTKQAVYQGTGNESERGGRQSI
jgi:hypothetical protein